MESWKKSGKNFGNSGKVGEFLRKEKVQTFGVITRYTLINNKTDVPSNNFIHVLFFFTFANSSTGIIIFYIIEILNSYCK